jgi:monoamine oxidase
VSAQSPTSSTSAQFDYAIAGGGVSGLYTAWRLLLDARDRGVAPPSIAIFESADRTGGRLLTWLPAGPDGGLRAELGGMRFMPQQELVWNLIGHLGFGDAVTKFWVGGPNLRLMLRGLSMPLDTPDPTVRYDLPASERARAGDLIMDAITNVLQAPENWPVLEELLPENRDAGGNITNMPATREDWDRIKARLSWRGDPLWNVGFWNLLSDVLTPETYQYITDTFGYYSLSGNWNAAEAMQFISLDFTISDYYQPDQGYSTLPNRLRDQAEAAGCVVNLNTRLASFEETDGGRTRLQLARYDGDDAPCERYTVEADHLVLAMPRRSLELLAPSGDFDLQCDRRLQRLVTSVRPQPAFKFYIFYDERWWERLGITHGRSVCDLPIRQTYYFAPQPWRGGGRLPEFGLLMASYDDARAVDFWRGLLPPEDEAVSGRADVRDALAKMVAPYLSGTAAANEFVVEPPPHLHKASPAMLAHARTQLALLHDIPESEIPDPVVGAYGDWGRDPFGGGWNFWNPRVDVHDVMTAVKTPLGPDRRVYIVGDSYSGAQGWVEGALTTTEVTLQEHLGLARPDWLPVDYYLGW